VRRGWPGACRPTNRARRGVWSCWAVDDRWRVRAVVRAATPRGSGLAVSMRSYSSRWPCRSSWHVAAQVAASPRVRLSVAIAADPTPTGRRSKHSTAAIPTWLDRSPEPANAPVCSPPVITDRGPQATSRSVAGAYYANVRLPIGREPDAAPFPGDAPAARCRALEGMPGIATGSSPRVAFVDWRPNSSAPTPSNGGSVRVRGGWTISFRPGRPDHRVPVRVPALARRT